MDDQGAGGSSRNHDRNPERRLMRESSLPPTLRPHLYHAPRHISSQGIAPLIVPDWPNQPTRSRSQDYGRSLPSPSHLLSQIPAQDHRMALEQGDVKGLQRDPRPQVGPFPSQSIRERTPPTTYLTVPFEERQRLQRLPSQPLRQQVHHQPQPQQPVKFPLLLSETGYQGGAGASSSSQLASSSRNQRISSFTSGLYSEGQSEIELLCHGSPMAKPPAIEAQEAAPERKQPHRSPAVKRESGTPTEEDGSTSASAGPTTSTRRKPSTKVEVACQFCRGRKLRCDGKKPCSNCHGRSHECEYQTGGPRRRGPGKAPKKTRAESSRQRQRQQQQQQQQQRVQQQFPPDQSQMSISTGSPGPSGLLPITIVPTTGIMVGGRPLTPGGMTITGSRFFSQSPGASTSGMETGSQSGSKRRLSGSSVEEPERKRSRIREFEGERRP